MSLDFRNLRPPTYLSEQYQRYAIQRAIIHKDLDEAQRKAVLSCFDRSLTIIQGPPGTGKTFIGALIFDILLTVQKMQRPRTLIPWHNIGKPIILVCYTNHALDQFLEKIEPYTKDIIRLGGRSKVERFKDYSLVQTCKKKSLTRGKYFYHLNQ